ncbi:MAG: glycosyltransferase family 2 protein [Pseudomonadota bacterium]
MDEPAISVVIPAYNRESLLPRALESVLQQTLTDFEIIVVDDASTDGTHAVASRYADDSRVRVVRQPQNGGAAAARNRGIVEARGRYVAFQDSDDRWFPEKLERQVALMQARQVPVCFCGALYFSRAQSYYVPHGDIEGHIERGLLREVLRRNVITPQTLVIEREALTRVGPFNTDLNINEDWDLAIRIIRGLDTCFVSDPLAVIYRSPGSVSSHLMRDVAFRRWLLAEYAPLYEANPEPRAAQHYVMGTLLRQAGRPGEAAGSFLTAFRMDPNPKTLAQAARAGLATLTTPFRPRPAA